MSHFVSTAHLIFFLLDGTKHTLNNIQWIRFGCVYPFLSVALIRMSFSNFNCCANRVKIMVIDRQIGKNYVLIDYIGLFVWSFLAHILSAHGRGNEREHAHVYDRDAAWHACLFFLFRLDCFAWTEGNNLHFNA